MIIHRFHEWLCAVGKSMEVELPQKGLKLDTRASLPKYVRFSICYHDDGITATLTRINDDRNYFGSHSFTMRAYDPQTETVPDFTSTIYMYMGLDGERAPIDTTLVIIHPSVKTIQMYAFDDCRKLIRRVMMHENVETIEERAFCGCHSLDAVFLPSSIKRIGFQVFYDCPSLRILSIPQTIDTDKIGEEILKRCHAFFHIAQLPPYYESNENRSIINSDQVHQALIDFNRNLPPLHKACLNTNVTAQSIRQCLDTHGIATAYNMNYGLDRMTPMHILALNPHANTDAILTLFDANMGAVFETYSEGFDEEDEEDEKQSGIGGKTLLDCLCKHDIDTYLSIIAALCRHREAHSSRTVEEPNTTRELTRNMNTDDEDHTFKRQKLN